MEVFALTLFGILLFPKVESFVDENPVTAILVNTYTTLDLCHSENNKKLLVCYLPVLFVWLISRFEEKVVEIKCPVESVL